MSLNKESLDKAIVAHAQWKNRLRAAIDSGTSEISPVSASASHLCDFGKWLAQVDASIQQTESWKKVNQLHSEFHKCASSCLSHAVTGQKTKAEVSMALGGDFAKATTALTTAMMAWKNEIK